MIVDRSFIKKIVYKYSSFDIKIRSDIRTMQTFKYTKIEIDLYTKTIFDLKIVLPQLFGIFIVWAVVFVNGISES